MASDAYGGMAEAVVVLLDLLSALGQTCRFVAAFSIEVPVSPSTRLI